MQRYDQQSCELRILPLTLVADCATIIPITSPMGTAMSNTPKNKRTPGPWSANGLCVSCAVGARENISICITTPNFENDGSCYANAEFIARAGNSHDEMLAALKAAVTAHGPFGDDSRPEWWGAACAAIAKAERRQ